MFPEISAKSSSRCKRLWLPFDVILIGCGTGCMTHKHIKSFSFLSVKTGDSPLSCIGSPGPYVIIL